MQHRTKPLSLPQSVLGPQCSLFRPLPCALLIQDVRSLLQDASALFLSAYVYARGCAGLHFQNSEKAAIEAFFRSQWFHVLSDLDGEYLIRKIQEEPNDK